jgi:predicted nucleotide-binding protein (sugar kinase/HSP70/actin superfamily)
VAGHSYVIEDEYFGKPVLDYLKENGVTVVRSDFVKRKDALKISHKVSPTLKWEISREIVGSLAMHYKDIDGVILLSVYPCALDSMVNDMLMRKNEMTKIPMLQLTLDAQSGTAGTETRLESFIDIIKMRKEAEVHGEEGRS